MKFFHLSDLHLGIRLRERSLRDDQIHILRKIVEAAKEEKPQAVVIAGDIFDKADPAAEAVALFNDFVAELKREVPDTTLMIVSGNHDNSERIDLYREVLKTAGVFVAGRLSGRDEPIAKVTLEDENGPVHFHLLPFVRPSAVRSLMGEEETALTYEQAVYEVLRQANVDEAERNVLVAHQFFIPEGRSADKVERMDSELPKAGNVDAIHAEVLKPFDYAALGHIHKPTQITERAYYCGTPLAYSMSERDQEKGIRVVELGADAYPTMRVLPLEPLHAVRRLEGTLEEVEQFPSADYVEVILKDARGMDAGEIRTRLRTAFPNLIGYDHMENRQVRPVRELSREHTQIDPLDLCMEFLGDADEENRRILKEILLELED